MSTQEQIESFYQFATAQLMNGGSELSVDELYDKWRLENVTDEEIEENIVAIQASIDDMNQGHSGRDAGIVITELRNEFNLPSHE
ncbi:hypothetical protein N8553_03490 [bacterium]|jgi:hypothetical protein|nr:hypothetical protein [bacterium]